MNSFKDPRDGQVYKTVSINGKTWFAENLRYKVEEGSSSYDDLESNGEEYGLLYNWDAAQQACPEGWRLPTDEELTELARHFGGYFDGLDKKTHDDPSKSFKASSTT